MKYIIACLISIGMTSAVFAQDYSGHDVSASEKNSRDPNYKHQINSGFYDRESRVEYPSVDPAKNDHLMPDRDLSDRIDEVVIKAAEKPDLRDESSFVDLNEHLTMGEELKSGDSELLNDLKQTQFGQTCSMKKLQDNDTDLSSAKSFKIKDKNFKAERKANGEEKVKFHNKKEDLVYHQKKNGKSHYKYSFKDKNTDLKVERKKSGEGFVLLKSDNIEEDASALLMEKGAFIIESDINSCLR